MVSPILMHTIIIKSSYMKNIVNHSYGGDTIVFANICLLLNLKKLNFHLYENKFQGIVKNVLFVF